MSYDDALGDKLTQLEQVETLRGPNAEDFIMVRLDGRAFSKFTSSVTKPYDYGIGDSMKYATKGLIDDLKPLVAYTQSDEITLIFDAKSCPFNGRLQKLSSICASKASVLFSIYMMQFNSELIENYAPCFDGRAIGVSMKIAATFIMWRELDGRRNAVSTAGREKFSQGQLRSKSPGEVKEMLLDAGINFYQDYPAHFRRGTILRKRKVRMELTEKELARIPEQHREAKRGMTFSRSKIVEIEDHPPLYRIENLEDFIFEDAEPIVIDKPFASHVTP